MKPMKKVTLLVEPPVYTVYEMVGEMAGDLPVERVMSRALLMLSVDLAMEILHKKQRKVHMQEEGPV